MIIFIKKEKTLSPTNLSIGKQGFFIHKKFIIPLLQGGQRYDIRFERHQGLLKHQQGV